MKLAQSGFLFRSMGMAVDYSSAHTTDTFTAIMVKGNGFLTFPCQTFVENIQHFQKRHVCGNWTACIGFQAAGSVRPFLAPDLKSQFY